MHYYIALTKETLRYLNVTWNVPPELVEIISNMVRDPLTSILRKYTFSPFYYNLPNTSMGFRDWDEFMHSFVVDGQVIFWAAHKEYLSLYMRLPMLSNPGSWIRICQSDGWCDKKAGRVFYEWLLQQNKNTLFVCNIVRPVDYLLSHGIEDVTMYRSKHGCWYRSKHPRRNTRQVRSKRFLRT